MSNIKDEIRYYKRLKSEARNKLNDIIDSMSSLRSLYRDIECCTREIERLEKKARRYEC